MFRREQVQDVIPEDGQPEMMDKIARGQFTMRIMYEQFQNILKMGPMGQVRCGRAPQTDRTALRSSCQGSACRWYPCLPVGTGDSRLLFFNPLGCPCAANKSVRACLPRGR
jgi:hypothetical protein